jgi:hypothetical protein
MVHRPPKPMVDQGAQRVARLEFYRGKDDRHCGRGRASERPYHDHHRGLRHNLPPVGWLTSPRLRGSGIARRTTVELF